MRKVKFTGSKNWTGNKSKVSPIGKKPCDDCKKPKARPCGGCK